MVIEIYIKTEKDEISFAFLGRFFFIQTFPIVLIFWKQDTSHVEFYTHKVENSEGTTKLCKPFELPQAKFWVSKISFSVLSFSVL